MTFRCSNGIRQGGQLSPLLYNVHTDVRNHHLQGTGVGCYVGGAWVNSLSYSDDMVLLAPTVTALQTLLEACRAYAAPHDIVYNTTKTACTVPGQFIRRTLVFSAELTSEDQGSKTTELLLVHLMECC